MARSSTSLSEAYIKEVRKACKNYHKPEQTEQLGRLTLASAAFFAELCRNESMISTDLALNYEARGQALRRAIDRSMQAWQRSVANLASGKLDLSTEQGLLCFFLYIYIYHRDPHKDGHFISGDVAEYVDENHYAKSYYFTKLNPAIQKFAQQLVTDLAQQTALLDPIPAIHGFVGREEALRNYRQQLDERNLVVIEGPAGIGKTMLAAQLACEVSQPCCWVTMRLGVNTSAEAILYAWALFLGSHGYSQLWALLQLSLHTDTKGNDSQDASNRVWIERIALLRMGMEQVRPLLCLDGLEVMNHQDSLFWSLLSNVIDLLESGVRVLITSRRRPPLSGLGSYERLVGFSLDDTNSFLSQHQIELSQMQIAELHRVTEGSPRFLWLWVTWLHMLRENSDDYSLLTIDTTKSIDDLAVWIVEGLDESEQAAAMLLALSRRPLDSALLQGVSSGQMVGGSDISPDKDLDRLLAESGVLAHDFHSLLVRGLIQEWSGGLWTLPQLIVQYLRAKPLQPRTIALHRCLAYMYQFQGNLVESAYHQIQIGAVRETLEQLDAQRKVLFERGQAPALLVLLSGLDNEQFDGATRSVLLRLRGAAQILLGEYEAAAQTGELAEQVAQNADERSAALQIQGEVAERQSNLPKAAHYYRQALLALETAQREVWLRRDLAWAIRSRKQDREQAWLEAWRARAALESLMGVLSDLDQKTEQALAFYKQAEQLAQKYALPLQQISAAHNRAKLYGAQEQWEKVVELSEQNLRLLEQIGDPHREADIRIQLGMALNQIGEHTQAVMHLSEAAAICGRLGDPVGEMLARSNLTETCLDSGQLAEAQCQIERAINIGKDRDPDNDFAEVLRVRAEVLLAHGETQAAWQQVERACAIASDEPFLQSYLQQTKERIGRALGE